jgi:hypothetical protein
MDFRIPNEDPADKASCFQPPAAACVTRPGSTSSSLADLVVANFSGSSLAVFPGSGTGEFTSAPLVPLPAASSPNGIAVGDLNGDGIEDLAIANLNSTVSILLGDGAGRFVSAPLISLPAATPSTRIPHNPVAG